jgi:hypothetical protein
MAEGVLHVKERCIQNLGGETWRKEPIRRPSRRWEENNKMELQEVEWGE